MSIKIEDSDSEDDKKEGGKGKEEVSHSSSFMAPTVGTPCQHPEADDESMASEDESIASMNPCGLDMAFESPQDADASEAQPGVSLP